MAYHRLGRGAEAQQLFQEVTQWMEKNAQASSPGPTDWTCNSCIARPRNS